MGIDPMRPAVFLDRDGVINEISVSQGVPHPPQSIEEFRFLPGVREACEALNRAGYLLIVVTNQPDVARGTQTQEQVEQINRLVAQELPVDLVLTCYHDNADECDCRKPKPGLLLEAASRWEIDLARSFMIGDRWSDAEAGKTAGCRTILIERDYSRRDKCEPDWIAQDLPTASRLISGM
jgi:D-glycero-D-manno-heptose 1,7-bisphosphate phosphatase